MARRAFPWYRKSRKAWFVVSGGKQINLGTDKAEAFRLFHELQARPKSARPVVTGDDFVETIAVLFVEWCSKHRAIETAKWYRERIQSFLSHVGDLRINELKPFHLDQWCDAHPRWSDGTKRGALIALQRCLSWAAKKGHIPFSPIAHIEKPQGGKRDYLITPEEYANALANIPSPAFRELLTISWESGCRPQESLIVEARHVDLAHSRWIFEVKNSKGKKRQRVVYLTEVAREITARLMLKYPEGPLFRTDDGRPFTPHSVNCQFMRLQDRLGRQIVAAKKLQSDETAIRKLAKTLKRTRMEKGIKKTKTERELYVEARQKLMSLLARRQAPKLCLYLFRHAWMTRMLMGGVDPITVSILAGHVDTSMLARQYQHLAHDADHLLAKAKLAK
ncbi:MAG: tyrosine-type recombinase/integrase [Planctomycetes bacterium]|nr:tyrosine-type recombinase/integrase [Planctomycetota bacterium]